jgi:hypothetical protein
MTAGLPEFRRLSKRLHQSAVFKSFHPFGSTLAMANLGVRAPRIPHAEELRSVA